MIFPRVAAQRDDLIGRMQARDMAKSLTLKPALGFMQFARPLDGFGISPETLTV